MAALVPPAVAAPRRIHIFGGPGCGKSTLAATLAETTDIPVYELDRVAFEGPEFAPRSDQQRLADARAIAREPSWIAEGIHLGWTDELLRRADVIVWLDYGGWSTIAVQIVRRFATSAAGEVRDRPAAQKFTRFGDYRRHLGQLFAVLRDSREYYRPEGEARRYPVTRDMAERLLAPYTAKLVRCTSRDEAELVRLELTRRLR